MADIREGYVTPEMEVIGIGKDDVILTSGCMIVSMEVSWEDGSGNRYSNTTPGF